MRHPIATLIVSLGAAALLVSPSYAQNRGGGGRGSVLGLLRNQGIHKELKLDSDQTEKLDKIATDIQEKHAADFQKIRDLDQSERREKMAELNTTIAAEVKKSLADVLKPEQIKRFHQIHLQVIGLQAFSDPKVQEKLNLTDDQKSKIREIGEAARAGRGAFNKDASAEEKAEARKKMVAAQRENMTKVQALLTPDQKSTWKELTGEPFEYQPQGQRQRAN